MGNAMKILFFLEPIYEINHPFVFDTWIQWFQRMNEQLELVIPDYDARLIAFDAIEFRNHDYFKGKRIIFSQSELRANWRYGGNLYRKLEDNNIDLDVTRHFSKIVCNKLNGFCPDVVFLLSDSPWLHKTFPQATFINLEVSWLHRRPYPVHWQIDTLGLGKGKILAIYHDEILSQIEYSTAQQDFVSLCKQNARSIIDRNREAIILANRLKENCQNLVLLPLSDRTPIDGVTSIFAHLDKYLESAPRDNCYLITMHPLTKALSDGESTYLINKYSNIYIDGQAGATIGTQSLLPHVQAIVGDLSSVGLQALFFDTEVLSASEKMSFDSHYNTFRNPLCPLLSRSSQKQKDKILYWLLTHSSVPEKKIFDGKWLLNFISIAVSCRNANKPWLQFTKPLYSIAEWQQDGWLKDISRKGCTVEQQSLVRSTIRAIAFHLPQYHPIPENDAWWGKGFTEWTNVRKARPLFQDHYQPHVPSELGYYDLLDPQVRASQAELARKYGIHGFCYYHYWFNGKLLLETPLHEILASGEPDLPFCLCWANEDWTRAWDGNSGQVLMKQNYSEEDDRRHIQYLCKFFKDRRYIRVNGKPLFLVYRASRIPDPPKTTDIWRTEAVKAGIGEIYLCRVESFQSEHNDPSVLGFDAAVEFQPDWSRLGEKVTYPDSKEHAIYSYAAVAANMISKPLAPYKRFPCVTPSWDNSARRPQNATVLIGSTPELYQSWLQEALRRAPRENSNESIVFINAWNEWGEGNHLEPDVKFGRGYLEATRRALTLNDRESALRPGNTAAKPIVSIVIPVFNNLQYTRQCLQALTENTPKGMYEVILIDNASSDGTKAYFSGLKAKYKIITNGTNVGFAKACNQGAQASVGNYIVFLNNDTIPLKNWLSELVDFIAKHPNAGAVGCKLLFPDNTVQHCGAAMRYDRKFFRHPYKYLPSGHPLVNKERELDAVTAACIITPSKVFFEVGQFDEYYLNGCEDMDYCTAVINAGYKIFYNPRSVLYHLESKTPRPLDRDSENFSHYVSKWGTERMKNEIEFYEEDGFYHRSGKNIVPVPDALEKINDLLNVVRPELRQEFAVRTYPLKLWLPRNRQQPALQTADMSVLAVSHAYPPYRFGGAQLYAHYLGKELCQAGINVTAFHPVGLHERKPGNDSNAFDLVRDRYDGISCLQVNIDELNQNFTQSFANEAVEQRFEEILTTGQYNIVHFHVLARLSARLPLIASRFGCVTIMTLHDYWLLCPLMHMIDTMGRECSGPESPEKCAKCMSHFFGPTNPALVKTLALRRKITMEALAAVHLVTSPSRFLADIYAHFGYRRPEVLPLGWLPIEKLPPVRESNKIVIGHWGQINHRKGVDILLAALQGLPTNNWELRIYGGNYEPWFYDKVMQYMRNQPNISYHGAYEPNDLARIASEVDFIVLPSRRENYPLVLLEALSAGIPVIASRVGGVAEIIAQGVNGFVFENGNVMQLMNIIKKLINDHDLVKQMRRNSKLPKTIAENALEYINILRSLQKKHPPIERKLKACA